ncbi:hypothetical protein [Halorarum salinum]|uniref:Uncharacterized protein n=1 Tax=Halorarum salinum TaxID=2743089 RepID=A0A7D5L9S9_9EURY|nr:hypothetical protein [Halobaculum salinum]QLG61474.1 hypothetical protein HUG12_06885 [Halobaculum salinum]
MPRSVPTVLVLSLVLLVGCSEPLSSQSPAATTSSPTVERDTFGTGGVFRVADANTAVPSRDAAALLRSARSNGSVDEPDSARFSYVPPDDVDAAGAIRGEIHRVPANATPYHFPSATETGAHRTVIVPETGHIYRAFVGAC